MVATGIGLMGAGVVVNALQTYRNTQAAVELAKFNAKVEKRNAEQQALMIEQQANLLEIERSREAEALMFDLEIFDPLMERALASTRAAVGASGTEFSGSNLLVAAEQAEQLSLQRSVMIYQSETRQADLQDEAALQRFQAGQVRRSGAFTARQLRRQASGLQGGMLLDIGVGAIAGGSAINTTLQRRSLLRRTGERRPARGNSIPMAFAPGE